MGSSYPILSFKSAMESESIAFAVRRAMFAFENSHAETHIFYKEHVWLVASFVLLIVGLAVLWIVIRKTEPLETEAAVELQHVVIDNNIRGLRAELKSIDDM